MSESATVTANATAQAAQGELSAKECATFLGITAKALRVILRESAQKNAIGKSGAINGAYMRNGNWVIPLKSAQERKAHISAKAQERNGAYTAPQESAPQMSATHLRNVIAQAQAQLAAQESAAQESAAQESAPQMSAQSATAQTLINARAQSGAPLKSARTAKERKAQESALERERKAQAQESANAKRKAAQAQAHRTANKILSGAKRK